MPVRVKKMRKNKNLEPRFDSIASGNDLEHFHANRHPLRWKLLCLPLRIGDRSAMLLTDFVEFWQ
jgi:hypothetical protein